MSVDLKRHIYSWVLLAVFVPMLIMSSVHVHKSTNNLTDDCNECVHHNCHGHLVQINTSTHACVLCQFLSLTFTATVAAVVVFLSVKLFISHVCIQGKPCLCMSDTPTLRGPPEFF